MMGPYNGYKKFNFEKLRDFAPAGRFAIARAVAAKRRFLGALVVASLVLPGLAFAAHPLITEDTGTQGDGRFEWENGLAFTRDADVRSFEYGPQLSYGALDTLDVIVRPTWVEQRFAASARGGRERGAGDTALDVKWRFHESGPLSFGTRAGVGLPTGNADKGLGAGRVSIHALAIATIDVAPLALHANAGYVHSVADGERRHQWQASVAAVWSAHERAKLTLDVAATTNADAQRASAPAVARAGAIFTIVEGFDVDAGYQARLNRAAPERVVLVGATLRW